MSRRAAAPAQRQHGVPAVRPVPAHVGARQRRLRAAGQEGRRRRGPPAGDARCSTSSGSASSPTAARRSSRAASSSASPWPGRWSTCPSALLLDEPLAALDLKLREAMQLELKRIQREVGITFIFVTHDQGEALTMSDRIAVMSRGRVEQIGTPEEIYDRAGEHLRRRVHRLGQPAAGHARGGATTARAGRRARLRRARRRRRGRRRAADGDPVTVMLRPERLTPSTATRRRRAQPSPASSRTSSSRARELRLHRRPRRRHRGRRHGRDRRRRPRRCRGRATPSRWLGARRAVPAPRAARRSSAPRRTDVDEVQATMDGTDVVADADAAADAAAEPPPERRVRPAGAAHRRRASSARPWSSAAVLAVQRRRRRRRRRRRPTAAAAAAAPAAALGTGDAEVRILNWTEYIDPTEDGDDGHGRPLQRRDRDRRQLHRDFNDNNEVYAKEFAAYLDAGNPTPWDIICPTNWMAARLKSHGLARRRCRST